MPNACKSHGLPSGNQWRTAEEHVRTCPGLGNNAPKGVLIPRTLTGNREESREAAWEGRAAHQVVGGVRASQAGDG